MLDLDTEELPIYERLLRELNKPRNHTIPCEIYREGHPLLIMPYLVQLDSLVIRDCTSLRRLLHILQELAEVYKRAIHSHGLH